MSDPVNPHSMSDLERQSRGYKMLSPHSLLLLPRQKKMNLAKNIFTCLLPPACCMLNAMCYELNLGSSVGSRDGCVTSVEMSLTRRHGPIDEAEDAMVWPITVTQAPRPLSLLRASHTTCGNPVSRSAATAASPDAVPGETAVIPASIPELMVIGSAVILTRQFAARESG